MDDRETEIRRIARQKFGVRGHIDDELRSRIERKYILPKGDEAVSAKYKGKTHAERLESWKRAEQRANEELKQREAIANPQPIEPESIRAKRLRIQLAESKLRSTTQADPQRRAHLQREIESAKADLATENLEQDRQAVETARREYVQSNPHYQRAMEHSNATVRLARFEDEDSQVETILRHKMLEQASPETAERVLKEYWAGVAQSEERQALAEQGRAVEESGKAAEAVGAATYQQEKVLNAQHRAQQARIQSEQ